MTTRAVAHCAN